MENRFDGNFANKQRFFSSKIKKNLFYKNTAQSSLACVAFIVLLNVLEEILSELQPIRLSARNRFKFTEHLDRIVEIIRPNERVGRKPE